MKLTPWFKPKIKPVHVGEYLTKVFEGIEIMRRWNGHKWVALGGERCWIQNRYWRGLARKPK